MRRDKLGDFLDPLGALHLVPERDRLLQDFVQFLDVADTFGGGGVQELPLQRFAVHEQVVGGELIVQRHRGAARDRLLDGVFVQVTSLVIGPEYLKVLLP